MRLMILTADSETGNLALELEAAGHKVTNCASVMAATALVEEFSPRAVLVDIKTRGARDFVRWLKKETGCGAIALLGNEKRDDCPVTGFDGWLESPYGVREVIGTLSKSGIETSGQPERSNEEEGFWDITKEIQATFETSDNRESEIYPQAWQTGQNGIRVVSQEVISLWGAKGGVGRTTLAIQLSRCLSDFDVLLIDLNFYEGPGDINVALDLPITPHIGKLLEEKNDRRRGFMESLIKPKNGSFAIVQPPPTIDQAEQICPDDIIELIDQARRCFQIIIIDLPPDLAPVTLEAIDLSTEVLFVSDESMGSLARLESIKSFVRKDVDRSIVLNKFNAGLNRAREISYFLDMPLSAVIQDIKRGIEKESYGKIKKDCDSIVNKGVEEIVEAVFGIEKQNTRKNSGFSRLIRGAISNIIG
jgi:cellulose biosynthesis protein BcsQ